MSVHRPRMKPSGGCQSLWLGFWAEKGGVGWWENGDGGGRQGQVSSSSYTCQVYMMALARSYLLLGIWYFFGGGMNSPPGGQMQNSRNVIFSAIKPRKDTAGRQTGKKKNLNKIEEFRNSYFRRLTTLFAYIQCRRGTQLMLACVFKIHSLVTSTFNSTRHISQEAHLNANMAPILCRGISWTPPQLILYHSCGHEDEFKRIQFSSDSNATLSNNYMWLEERLLCSFHGVKKKRKRKKHWHKKKIRNKNNSQRFWVYVVIQRGFSDSGGKKQAFT